MNRKCPICRSDSGELIFHRDFHGMDEISLFLSYDIRVCDVCGMIYAFKAEENYNIANYYKDMSKYETEAWRISEYAKNIYMNGIHLLKPYMKKDSLIFDIGCGNGNLLKLLKDLGYRNLYGLDTSANNCKFIKENLGIKAFCGFLKKDLPELNNTKFDVVILQGVLEHILPVSEFIEQAISYLNSNGYLYIAVPDVRTFAHVHDLYQEFSSEHINYFSLDLLKLLMSKFNMCLVDFSYYLDVGYSIWCRNECKCLLNNIEINNGTNNFRDMDYMSISQYKDNAVAIEDKIKSIISKYVGESIYIWGVGVHTAMLYQLQILDGINVVGMIDSNENYVHAHIYGKLIFSPNDEINAKYPILISSKQFQKSILDQIKKMGFKNEIITLY